MCGVLHSLPEFQLLLPSNIYAAGSFVSILLGAGNVAMYILSLAPHSPSIDTTCLDFDPKSKNNNHEPHEQHRRKQHFTLTHSVPSSKWCFCSRSKYKRLSPNMSDAAPRKFDIHRGPWQCLRVSSCAAHPTQNERRGTQSVKLRPCTHTRSWKGFWPK